VLRRTLCVVAVVASLGLPCSAFAQKQPPSEPDKAALAAQDVKDLLLLIDTDKNGKISKQEWMKFMESEFDRLDKDKNGELDPKELSQSRVSVKAFHFSDQGK
jgi:hypothetical protein